MYIIYNFWRTGPCGTSLSSKNSAEIIDFGDHNQHHASLSSFDGRRSIRWRRGGWQNKKSKHNKMIVTILTNNRKTKNMITGRRQGNWRCWRTTRKIGIRCRRRGRGRGIKWSRRRRRMAGERQGVAILSLLFPSLPSSLSREALALPRGRSGWPSTALC